MLNKDILNKCEDLGHSNEDLGGYMVYIYSSSDYSAEVKIISSFHGKTVEMGPG